MNQGGRKYDNRKARGFSNVLRFIGDLTAFKDSGKLKQSFQEICHPELVFKGKKLSNNEESFLDLINKAENNQFLSSFVRKNNSSFSIVRMSCFERQFSIQIIIHMELRS